MNDEEYKIERSDPYVHTDFTGKEVILQDETLLKDGVAISLVEKLINPHQSEQEKFKVRLKNPD